MSSVIYVVYGASLFEYFKLYVDIGIRQAHQVCRAIWLTYSQLHMGRGFVKTCGSTRDRLERGRLGELMMGAL